MVNKMIAQVLVPFRCRKQIPTYPSIRWKLISSCQEKNIKISRLTRTFMAILENVIMIKSRFEVIKETLYYMYVVCTKKNEREPQLLNTLTDKRNKYKIFK